MKAKTALVISICLLASGASADTWSDEFKAGWCEGYSQAVKLLRENRDHWRSLVGAPKMSHEEVIKWIYARPWIDGTTLRTAPRTLGQPPGIPQVGPPVVESADLYLFLSEIPPGRTIIVHDAEGTHRFHCNALTN